MCAVLASLNESKGEPGDGQGTVRRAILCRDMLFSPLNEELWSSGAMLPRHPTNLGNSWTRACYDCSRCGYFFSCLSFLFSFLPLSGRQLDID